ncbi:hypothetical protein [Iningainema tapete]|uniref:Uncharacterized protein n=1 Tax=Iningainema tapete BLCC-T55 TaxID=2748662 RepID=A0A8J6XYI4_9CYAN|nr:hypothetical protein [Iningainema tapete]MBD2775423.1 hypothetical protein [Iningainema tapete BLCC-T55]
MSGFVYSQKNASLDELKSLLEKLAIEPSYYFLRSAHAVSGICRKLPEEFATPEGQMFNADHELRWKKQKSGYDVLLLSIKEVNLEGIKKDCSSNWEICDFNAYFYKNETKFPNGFTFKGLSDEDINPEDIHISQRYFKDAKTATVHFIALTVKEK